MNNKFFGTILFAVGAAIGSAVTWKIVKTKYEQIAQEEIDSVKSEFGSLMQSMRDKLKTNTATAEDDASEEDIDDDYPEDDERDFTEHEKEMIEYYKITSKYCNANKDSDKNNENNEEGGNGDEDEEEVPYVNGPYVISAEEFCGIPGYNAQPLDYFADGILADSLGVQVDIKETIGEDALSHFGDEQDDIVYVRSEREETDYEITRDPRTYEEAIRSNPNPYYDQ